MAKVVLGIPTTGSIETRTFEALFKIDRKEHNIFPLVTEHALVYMARDSIVNKMLENPEAEYIWFVDSDIIVEKDTLNKLVKADKDIVSGCYPYKSETGSVVGIDANLETITMYDLMKEKDHTVKIARAGMGCCLIKRCVLEDVMAKYNTCFTPMGELGEDYAFCERAKECGYDIWIDREVILKHIGKKVYEVK